jgi:N-acyl-D-amino-acid deacylase
MPGLNPFSAFPGFLIKFVREMKIFTLEQAISKISTTAAEQHNLNTKGKILPGYDADITVFDLDGLKITGDAVEPRRYPEGFEYVFVNGEAVVENGKHTGATPGKIVKRGDKAPTLFPDRKCQLHRPA